MKKLEYMTEPELAALMTHVAKSVEKAAAEMGCAKPLFALVMFNDPEIAQYIGNCQRSDIIKAMRETADRLELKQDLPR